MYVFDGTPKVRRKYIGGFYKLHILYAVTVA